MKKVVLVYGLIAGFVVSLIMCVSMAIYAGCDHSSASMLVGYASMLLAFSMIFVGIKNFRDKQNAGFISFGKAFKIGTLIALIAATMYVIAWAIEYHFFMPDFMDKYTASSIEDAKKAGASAVELQKIATEANKMQEMYKNPFFFVLFTYAEILPVGLIVTLIASLILKRKKQTVVPA